LDSRPEHEQVLHQWFAKMQELEPEIIVIGFQELVDLESVRNTDVILLIAMNLFVFTSFSFFLSSSSFLAIM
jgi:hypothetical protein